MAATRSPSSSPLSSILDVDSNFSLSLSPSPIARRSRRSSTGNNNNSVRDTRSGSSAVLTEAAKTSVTVTTTEIDAPSSSPSSSSSPSPSKKPSVETEASQRPKRKAAGRKKLTKKPPKTKGSKWDAERLVTDPKSPLAKANLRTILSNPIAWTILNKDEQSEILSLFPDQEHILDPGTHEARPNFASLLNDDSFRYDCAAYTANLAQGRHDPEWLAQAWAAHERRKAGDYEDYLMEKLQNDWGVGEMPDEKRIDSPQPEVQTDEASRDNAIQKGIGIDEVTDVQLEALDDTKMDIDATEGNG